jgi:hypothetical protein
MKKQPKDYALIILGLLGIEVFLLGVSTLVLIFLHY